MVKAYLAACVVGVFAFDEKKNILTYRIFQKNPEKIADKLASEKLIEEEKQVIEDLKKSGIKEVVSEKKAKIPGLKATFEKPNLGSEVLKNQFRKLGIDLQFAEDQAELNQILSAVSVAATRTKLKHVKRDKIIMHVSGVVDELDKVSNTLSERLREWYGLHAPEVAKAVASHEKFAELIHTYGHRAKIDDKKLKTAKKSAGMEFEERDITPVQMYAKEICRLYTLREELAKYLEKICKETVPNTSAVAGPLLAAKLLQLAGGLDKLSRVPSSTMQLLGAEKALFRHMRGQGKAPKYGVIYQHSLIQNAHKELRGKVARLLASKLTLAARIDAYSDRDDGQKLRKDLEETVKKLRKK